MPDQPVDAVGDKPVLLPNFQGDRPVPPEILMRAPEQPKGYAIYGSAQDQGPKLGRIAGHAREAGSGVDARYDTKAQSAGPQPDSFDRIAGMGDDLNALGLPLEAMADHVPSDDPDRPDDFSDRGQQWRTLKTRTRGPAHPVTRN